MSDPMLDAPSTPSRARLLCAVDDLVPWAGIAGRVSGSEVPGRQVAVFLLPGETPEVRVLGNYDPIGGAPVLSRGIVGDVAGEAVVASPLYKHHFSLVDGRCLEQDDVSVPVYRTLVSDGWVYLLP